MNYSSVYDIFIIRIKRCVDARDPWSTIILFYLLWTVFAENPTGFCPNFVAIRGNLSLTFTQLLCNSLMCFLEGLRTENPEKGMACNQFLVIIISLHGNGKKSRTFIFYEKSLKFQVHRNQSDHSRGLAHIRIDQRRCGTFTSGPFRGFYGQLDAHLFGWISPWSCSIESLSNLDRSTVCSTARIKIGTKMHHGWSASEGKNILFKKTYLDIKLISILFV